MRLLFLLKMTLNFDMYFLNSTAALLLFMWIPYILRFCNEECFCSCTFFIAKAEIKGQAYSYFLCAYVVLLMHNTSIFLCH